MALFKKTSTTKTDVVQVEKSRDLATNTNIGSTSAKMSHVIRPHITEKSIKGEKDGQYIFLVNKNAAKKQIKQEIEKLHKVSVVSVNIIRQEKNQSGYRGRNIRKVVVKKAVVTLKKGDKIDSGVK